MWLKFELIFAGPARGFDPIYMDHTECMRNPKVILHFTAYPAKIVKEEEDKFSWITWAKRKLGYTILPKDTIILDHDVSYEVTGIVISVPDHARQRTCRISYPCILAPGDTISLCLENVVQSFLAGLGVNDVEIPAIQVE